MGNTIYYNGIALYLIPQKAKIFIEHMHDVKVDISTMLRKNLMLLVFEASRWPVYKNKNRMYPSNLGRKEISN